MKIAATIARYLLGVLFTVFGLNMFFNFIPAPPPPPGYAGQFSAVMMATHYMYAVGSVMVVSGLLFLANLYVPLALVLLAPVLYNILIFHIVMNPSGIGMGLFATLLWLLVAWYHREAFAGILQKRA
jgi:hypothetical protein